MKLFDMTEDDIQRAVDAHDAVLMDIYYGSGPEPCCKYCKYFSGSECCLCEWKEEIEDYKLVDDDDYCDYYKQAEG